MVLFLEFFYGHSGCLEGRVCKPLTLAGAVFRIFARNVHFQDLRVRDDERGDAWSDVRAATVLLVHAWCAETKSLIHWGFDGRVLD